MGSFRYYILSLSLFWLSTACADNLTQVYQLAVLRDPTLAQAYAAMQANSQALPEAIAQMVPNLSANYQTTGTETKQGTPNPFVALGGYNTQNYSLTLNQPIYHPEHWAQLEQSRHVVKAAQATYLSATQTLIVTVAKQYFAILAALDDLDYARGQLKAFSREYEQAKQRFDVGIIAITDVETAKARYDNAVATEISAKNLVADQYEQLRVIVGIPIQEVTLFPVTKKLELVPPNPNKPEAWVDTAHKFNLDVIAAKENANVSKADIGTQVAGHYPKFDIQGKLNRTKSGPPFEDLTYNRSVSLNVTVPIFAGGGVLFRTKEASARYDEALQKLEQQQRLADSSTREAYRGVLTAMSRVDALAQAVVSNESSLKATKAAYEVGTRTIVDVLNAESQLLSAQRDHAKARYEYLLQGLILKQKAGTLTSDDLYCVNNLFAS
ncbi:MAG: TolC family outer membrane protein [Gammaproteobacteria bacterium]|jgi:outer membrane protein|nr:TolC family outer membrane protein [Gammaproteobacteria bacterium]